jgi:DNA (cytosine-5)-methyltransferase 1
MQVGVDSLLWENVISFLYQNKTMPKEILIRNIPDDVCRWIEKERTGQRMSQREFIVSALEKMYSQSLFDAKKFDPGTDDDGSASFRFIDLFAGIGGFRIALENLGGKCVYTSEWDKYAQKTYRAWFGEIPDGDLTKVNPKSIPDHEILAAGFPCQPFSIAGVSKKKSLGLAHGFKDKKQGNLFFYLAAVIKEKHPPVVLLENVKNLRSHDGGKTWRVIHDTLEELGYVVFDKTIDAAHWVPQHRERIFIVCFDKKTFGNTPDFSFPVESLKKSKLIDILEKNPDPKYTLTPKLWQYLQDYAKKHREKGNGFGYGMPDLNGISRTLSARYYKDGSEVLITQGAGKRPRRLTPRECARLMGFPDKYKIVVSDTQAYKQFGNALVPPIAEAVGRQALEVLKPILKKKNRR